MLGMNARQCMRGSQILGLLLGILVLFSSVVAEAGGSEDQHVTGDPAERTWTKDITEPYWSLSGTTYTYYGLFVELSSAGHYSIDSSLSLNLQDISGDSDTRIYGVHYANSSGTLEVHNSIDIIAAGLNPVGDPVANTAIDITGISAGANDVTTSADITLTATGGTASVITGSARANVTNAYGIHGTGGAVTNTGDVTINAEGGNATASADANVSVYACGLYGQVGGVTNSGDISVTGTAGKAKATDTYGDARSYAEVRGITSYGGGPVTNTGTITAKATGGEATAAWDAYATGMAYGVSTSGGVTNTGTVSATGTGGTTTYFANGTAYGISNSGSYLINEGVVSATATGGTTTGSRGRTFASAYGISNGGGAVTNTGTTTSKASGGTGYRAYAYAYGIQSGAGAVTNTGTTTSEATGGVATGSDAYTYAYGINTSGAVDNAGVISTTAKSGTGNNVNANAYGINSSWEAVTNSGTISTTAMGGVGTTQAEATTRGISSKGAVDNVGVILSTAEGGTATTSYGFAYASAVGIFSSGPVNNAGVISSIAKGGTIASGSSGSVFAESNGIYSQAGKAVTNTGTITSKATGGIVESGSSGAAYAYAYAINSDGAVTNAGTLISVATGGTVNASSSASIQSESSGIRVNGKDTVINTGTISATAYAGTQTVGGSTTSGNASAYGIHFTNGGELRSSGLISADAQFASGVSSSGATRTAYQVYCESGTLSIKQYAMEVGQSQNTFTAMYEGQFGTKSGAIAYDDTELVVYLNDTFQNGVYDIPRLWKQETEEQKAAAINQFATLDTSTIAAVPGLNISLIPSSDVDTPQKLKMEYAPKESTPLKQARVQMNVESAIHSLIENNLIEHFSSGTPSGVGSTLGASASSYGVDGSSAGMVASLSNPNILPAVTSTGTGQHSLLFRPVYVNSYDSATSGYSSNTYGFVVGYDYKVYEDSNDCIIGVHAGYTRGDIRYTGNDYGDRKEFVDTYYGGVHGLSRFAEDFIVSGEASFFYTDSDMRDDEPTRLGKADYDSVALRAEASVGYLWEIAEHTIIPELGLDYSWQHRDSFTVDNQNSPDIRYGTLDNNELYATARLKWLARYELSPTWTIIPLVGVGVTQVLTDGEISNTMRFGNATQMVVDQDENTTFTPEVNITLSSDDYQFMAGYSGGFGGTTKNNMFWLQLAVSF